MGGFYDVKLTKMMTRRRRTQSVRDFILNRAGEHPGDVSRITGLTSGISDQSVAKHGENLVDQGLLWATGRANGREYSLEALFDHTFGVNVTPGMAEIVDLYGRQGTRRLVGPHGIDRIAVDRDKLDALPRQHLFGRFHPFDPGSN